VEWCYWMINLKSKQGRVKRTNNEKWFQCSDCEDFIFTVYQRLSNWAYMYCPRCGGRMCKGIKPPTLSARENYKPWKDEELVYIHQVLNKEIMPYQCAIKLDRSLASIESKCRREKKNVKKM
jgi:hypothetical protein